MIENADQYLKDWIGSVISDADISLSLPVEQSNRPMVSLYLLDLHPSPPAKGPRRTPLQIVFRYLVTSWAQRAEEAHALLSELVFAAMEHTELEVDLEPVPASLWQAFGILPGPAFMLRVPIRRERPATDVMLVNSGIEMKHSPMASLEGLLMGPDDIPIANAIVDLPAYHLATRTDSNGRFWFSGVPAKPAVKRFRIQARGRHFAVEAEPKAEGQGPIIINFNLGEV